MTSRFHKPDKTVFLLSSERKKLISSSPSMLALEGKPAKIPFEYPYNTEEERKRLVSDCYTVMQHFFELERERE